MYSTRTEEFGTKLENSYLEVARPRYLETRGRFSRTCETMILDCQGILYGLILSKICQFV